MSGNGARTIFLFGVYLGVDARFGQQLSPSFSNRPLKTPPRPHLRRGYSLIPRLGGALVPAALGCGAMAPLYMNGLNYPT
jgi:hypothetical protein